MTKIHPIWKIGAKATIHSCRWHLVVHSHTRNGYKWQYFYYLILWSISSLNNPQNSEMKFCENMVDMLKIIIIIIGYILNNFTTHIILSMWKLTLGYNIVCHNLYFKVSSWKWNFGQSILYIEYTTFQIAKGLVVLSWFYLCYK
jgi:hypothetical protein